MSNIQQVSCDKCGVSVNKEMNEYCIGYHSPKGWGSTGRNFTFSELDNDYDLCPRCFRQWLRIKKRFIND